MGLGPAGGSGDSLPLSGRGWLGGWLGGWREARIKRKRKRRRRRRRRKGMIGGGGGGNNWGLGKIAPIAAAL